VFNGSFWIAIVGGIGAVIGLIFTAINKSKCQEIACCYGLFKCVRDTQAETEIEERRLELRIPESPKNNIV